MRSSIASSKDRPTKESESGMPFAPSPQGSTMAGCPVALKGEVMGWDFRNGPSSTSVSSGAAEVVPAQRMASQPASTASTSAVSTRRRRCAWT